MSFFSLCAYSRKIVKNAVCILCTYPGKNTYAKNDKFLNNENVYRWEQIVSVPQNLKHMILHIPEYYAKDFYGNLNYKERKFLTNIPNLHINVLNQNIEIMPPLHKLLNLYKLTQNITQTTAHNKYCNQEICNTYNMPTHLFSTHLLMDKYQKIPFAKKQKIIVLSPDENKYKENIVLKLKNNFKDYTFVVVKNMSFTEYINLISKAFFTITFGEGFDGYFLQPISQESISFAVYNEEFFPSKDWMELKNVYASYEDMQKRIVDDMNMLLINQAAYEDIIKQQQSKTIKLYSEEQYIDNLTRFYEGRYDYYPINKG